MKRILILILSLGFALMFASGCGEDDPVIDVGDETYNPVINYEGGYGRGAQPE